MQKRIRRAAIALALIHCLLFPFFVQSQTPIISFKEGFPIGESNIGVAYGNGVYVTVFDKSRVYYSSDLQNWTKVMMPEWGSSGVRSISFGAGLFVVAGQSGLIASSPDGINWTTRTSGTSNHISDIKFLENNFYAVGNNRTILRSSDGINWSTITVSVGNSTDNLIKITYGAGKFVIGARHASQHQSYIFYSTTGANNSWSVASIASHLLNQVKYLQSRFYAFMSSASIFTSTDGVSWTNSSTTLKLTQYDNSVVDLGAGASQVFQGVYDGSKIFLFGNHSGSGGYGAVFSSTDGTNFTLEPRSANIVAQGAEIVNGKYFQNGNEGLVMSENGSQYDFFGGSFYGVAKNAAGTYVAVGGLSGVSSIYTSTDFQNWSNKSSGSINSLYTVINDGTRFVAAGSKTVAQSSDGNSWSVIATPPLEFSSLLYTGSGYLAVASTSGSLGVIVHSSDGINWTTRNTENNWYYRIRKVNNNYFVLGTNNATYEGVLLHSADGITWTDITPSLSITVTAFYDVIYNGSNYVFVGIDDAYEFFSVTSPTPWVSASYGNLSVVPASANLSVSAFFGEMAMAFSNGKYVVSAFDQNTSNLVILYSTDGINWAAEDMEYFGGVFEILAEGDKFSMRTSANSILQVNFSGTLPVLLNSFTAKAVQQDVQLDWQTMMEQNSKSFIPEHSADGRQWRKLHEIPASGNSQEKKEYSYLHRRPGAGIHYYRLLQIDLDGKQTHSEVRRVHINDLSKLRIVPNPAIADVVVQRDKSDEVEIIVFDAVGSTVYRTKTSGSSITLPASGWSAGLYRISIQGKESKQMLSFVKE